MTQISKHFSKPVCTVPMCWSSEAVVAIASVMRYGRNLGLLLLLSAGGAPDQV